MHLNLIPACFWNTSLRYTCLNILSQTTRKSGFGASDELSSEEEEGVQPVEAILPKSHQERLPASTWPASAPMSSVRKRSQKCNPKPPVRAQVNLVVTQDTKDGVACSSYGTSGPEGCGTTSFVTSKQEGASVKETPTALDRLRPSEGSRPASDTDDTLWEELLQGPDSASTGSSDSESNARFTAAGMALPATATMSSDDESLQQGIAGVRPSSILFMVSRAFRSGFRVRTVMENLEVTEFKNVCSQAWKSLGGG